ncbi:MAG TPA: FAD:protein FMN transferase, partial [Solirubrobacteraceae bacterium]|nr:FAD:protein FMN transferase [Solirubrobacteraceae bacterium]
RRQPRVVIADESFSALGTTVRIVVEAPDAETLARRARQTVEEYDRRLSRFRPDSELCALNADPRERVPASSLLRDAVRAGLWAAARSGGLVDPTLLPELEAAGYRDSIEPRTTPLLPDRAPRPARPRPDARWRAIRVEDDAVIRPPGLRLDLGGTGKGHVADLVAQLLGRTRRWAIDCGGDVRVGGAVEQAVVVAHPFGGEAARLALTRGAVATSAVHARAWEGGHHLIDPATGEPAWTGIVAATASGETTLEAETKAKMALLGGPPIARELAMLFVLADGQVVDAR